MPINLANSALSKIYLGNSEISKAYLGNNQIYPNTFSGVLDEFSLALTEPCYSLRKLTINYTGNAVRVRRTSDNAETNIGFLDNGDFDIATLNTFCNGTNGFVTTWYDQGVNGINVTQTTASKQPKIYDSATGIILRNGKPAILFIATSFTCLINTSYTLATRASNTATFNLVGDKQNTTTSASLCIIPSGNSPPIGNLFEIAVVHLAEYKVVNYAFNSSSQGDNFVHVPSGSLMSLTVSLNAGVRVGSANNLIVPTETSGAVGYVPEFFSLGGRSQQNLIYLSGYISEFMILDTVISNADRSYLELNQMDYYNL